MTERNNNLSYGYDNTPLLLPTTTTTTTNNNNNNNNNNQEEQQQSNFLQSNPRCPPLDGEFLWKTYHRLKSTAERNENVPKQIETLKLQGFPTGLASLIVKHTLDHPIRIWLVDNCGTMHNNDGHRVAQSSSSSSSKKNGMVEVVECSRWEEATATVIWHAEMGGWLKTPTAVRLLKDPGHTVGPQQCGVCASKHLSSNEEIKRLKGLLRQARPMGASSPIVVHLQEITTSIQQILPVLEAMKMKFVVYICTDSIPSNEEGMELSELKADFDRLLKQLVNWPVQVILRISTDEERVVEFYEEMMREPHFINRLQVLDDFVSECSKVKHFNPWLNYGFPLHLCREAGVCITAIEQLGQRKLTYNEVVQVVCLIFNIERDNNRLYNNNNNNPKQDYKSLRKEIKKLNEKTGNVWSPITGSKKFVPWINLKQLDKALLVGGAEKCIIS